jgi:predicted HD phosphohydrolase
LIEYLTGDGIVTVGDHTLQFSRLAYRSGGNLKLLASADLQNWTTLAESNNAAPMSVTKPSDATLTESGDFRKVVHVQIRATSAYRYFRLAADLTP